MKKRKQKDVRLVTDRYTGDPAGLPAGPWREEGQLLAEVEWTEEAALVTSASLSQADRLKRRLTKDGFVHRGRSVGSSIRDVPLQPMTGLKDFKTEFFQRWLDEPLEPLDGRTPREAKGDRRLLDLVRNLEAREARLPEPERYDFAAIRAELGL